QSQGESLPPAVASDLLRTLVPEELPDQRNLTNKQKQALPGVVREVPGRSGVRGIRQQDLLAVLTMAAKERQQRLEALEAQEAAENELLDEQEGLVQALLSHVDLLSERFGRLRRRSPRPPQPEIPGS
ncbi:unnamed protein product, partial [Polarella glacialis]